jgi:transcriptional regulator with XRE-family HTH domain
MANTDSGTDPAAVLPVVLPDALALLKSDPAGGPVNGEVTRSYLVALGERVRDYRQAKGLGQRELAGIIGVGSPYLSELEAGKRGRPSIRVLDHLAAALGVSLDDLLGRAGPPGPAVPAELAEFAARRGLPEVDVAMLAGIQFRGAQPRTAARWEYLYDSIRCSEMLDRIGGP